MIKKFDSTVYQNLPYEVKLWTRSSHDMINQRFASYVRGHRESEHVPNIINDDQSLCNGGLIL